MAKNKSEGLQKARVLGGFVLDGITYVSNDIIEASAELIKQLGSSVDADPGAVDHCLDSCGSMIKTHKTK